MAPWSVLTEMYSYGENGKLAKSCARDGKSRNNGSDAMVVEVRMTYTLYARRRQWFPVCVVLRE